MLAYESMLYSGPQIATNPLLLVVARVIPIVLTHLSLVQGGGECGIFSGTRIFPPFLAQFPGRPNRPLSANRRRPLVLDLKTLQEYRESLHVCRFLAALSSSLLKQVDRFWGWKLCLPPLCERRGLLHILRLFGFLLVQVLHLHLNLYR